MDELHLTARVRVVRKASTGSTVALVVAAAALVGVFVLAVALGAPTTFQYLAGAFFLGLLAYQRARGRVSYVGSRATLWRGNGLLALGLPASWPEGKRLVDQRYVLAPEDVERLEVTQPGGVRIEARSARWMLVDLDRVLRDEVRTPAVIEFEVDAADVERVRAFFG